MLQFRKYDTLPPEAVQIRQEVFVEEQGFEGEFDEIDSLACHILLFNDQTPVGVCRFYADPDRDAYILGRVAVRKDFRGRSLGMMLVREAERQVRSLHGRKLLLAAQVRAKEFYEKQGYAAEGEEFLDEFCPHIWMSKSLEE